MLPGRPAKERRVPSTPTIEFLGGAGTVTGSMHLLTLGNRRILLDCGLLQGLKELRLRNWADRVPDPRSLDAVVLSHAHLDHTGYLPRLVKAGYGGPVYCTSGTEDLLGIMLPDAAHLQEEQAEHANFKGFAKHAPALPLYSAADALGALDRLVPQPYGREFTVVDGVTVQFRRAGHILGSATVDLGLDGGRASRLVFSGDLGRPDQPILRDPEPVPAADVLLLESTYGNRRHEGDPVHQLARIVSETARRGGVLLIPAFAVGRTQTIVWLLRRLEQEGRIPVLPTYVDSPLAIDATEIYLRHAEDHDVDMERLMRHGDNPLTTRHFHLARSRDESRALNALKGPVVIISASGMATGGRVLHHLQLRLPDPRTTVLLVGFQAAGTRGRSLQEGAKALRILGAEVAVRARVEMLDGLSAHADQAELLDWMGRFQRPPRRVHLVHGEPEGATALAEVIRQRFKCQVDVAQDRATVPVAA
jgi:metallo-beta-lactamase family protein